MTLKKGNKVTPSSILAGRSTKEKQMTVIDETPTYVKDGPSLLVRKHQINLAKAKLAGATSINMPLYEYANIIGYLEAYELKIEAYRDKLAVYKSLTTQNPRV
jgi:hypothetical protein